MIWMSLENIQPNDGLMHGLAKIWQHPDHPNSYLSAWTIELDFL